MKHVGLVLLGLAACGGDDTGGGGGGGGNCPDYADIIGGTFSRTGATTTWTMTVIDMPPTLVFNQDGVPANVLEYRWAIDLDANSDGTDDLQLSIQHFRTSAAAETVTTEILMETQQDLWTLMGAAGSVSGDITASLEGDVLTFVVDDGEDAMLPSVTMASQGTWNTFTKYGPALDDQCEDEFKP